MLDYTHLETLAAVLRSGSFEVAAAQLGLTQSAVSQRIRHLEERIGTALVNRAQPCTGTAAGLRLAHHAEDVALLESRLTDTLPRPAARLRMALNADSLATWVLPALAPHRDLLFDLVLDDQDHSADWLKRGEVSGAITGTAQPPQGCNSVALGALRYVATASPAFLARHFAHGVTPQALAQAPMLTFNRKDRLQLNWLHTRFGPMPMPPTHLLPSTQGFAEAALLGLGWGMNPEPLVRPHLARGTLVPLCPQATLDTPLFWQTSRMMAPALAPVTRSIRDAAATALIAPEQST
ncbi:LysR family transcriptional regulator ArgP [Thalassovita taeanensis]|uniref:LysR family transcriptional regulator, chromosome initiation inhibitor n=1 Tax=Thalassovita taeanensis TaxID=657014 RepID=A0A1H9EFQ9_9RHOB|nr:LysR family transcriptional regulator ArgP [Thalassovita taeanensis]SEQ24093.1 LysR family transcriptional regulator, chromosome initiation inhibitor [Thalassovita taeanensis]